MAKKFKVIFQPSGRRGEIEEGKTVLEAGQALGVDIEGLCGNKKVCGKCKVRIEEGYFEKDNLESGMAHLSPLTESEKKHIKPEDGPGIRLACTAEIHGDIKVFVPERSRAGKQVVRKAAKELSIALDPAVKKYNVVLTPPTLHDMTVGDYERVLQSLEENYGLKGLTWDFVVLRDLQDTLRRGEWNATVTVWMDREIVKVEPFLGVAFNNYVHSPTLLAAFTSVREAIGDNDRVAVLGESEELSPSLFRWQLGPPSGLKHFPIEVGTGTLDRLDQATRVVLIVPASPELAPPDLVSRYPVHASALQQRVDRGDFSFEREVPMNDPHVSFRLYRRNRKP